MKQNKNYNIFVNSATAKLKNIFTAVLVLLLLCLAVISPVGPMAARADASVTDFDNIDIMDDLTTSTVDGKPFDISDYPFKAGAPMRLFSFIEYCYGYKAELQGNYGLYLYIYNPGGVSINTSSLSNKVQLATSYNTEGKPNDYSKFNLQFCSKITGGDYNNLFYKFKVINVGQILNRINAADVYKRRYDVSGFYLMANGAQTAEAYTVGYTYTFTGFAAGFGNNNSTSTLECSPVQFETIPLNLQYTNYRPNGWSSLGEYHQDDLTSVYFSAPNEYMDKYGKIKRIKTEWWEYKTSSIIAVNDKTLFDYLYNYVGVNIGYGNEDIKYRLFSDYTADRDFNLFTNWAWNENGPGTQAVYADYTCSAFYYLFYENAATNKFNLSNEIIKAWIYSYAKTAEKGYLPIKNGNISADLFEDYVDKDRTMGYNEKIFDVDDSADWLDVTSKTIPSAWSKFWGAKDKYEPFPDLSPIEFLTDEHLEGTNDEISKRLCINVDDVSTIKTRYASATAADETIVLLRVANTDYYSIPLHAAPERNWLIDTGYVCSETVFLDFTVIWLDFAKDGISTIIPIAASPIDIISGTTPPIEEISAWDEFQSWWEELKAILAIVWSFLKQWGLIILAGVIFLIVLSVLMFVFPAVAKGAWAVIKLIGKGLWLLLKGIFYVVASPVLLIIWLVKRRKGDG